MNVKNETYEILVGLCVTDDRKYNQYRAAMTPILQQYGGSFRYDFVVAEVLKSEAGEPINRLFIITFPDEQAKEAFFADQRYVSVRAEFFEPAVGAVTSIAQYVRQAATEGSS